MGLTVIVTGFLLLVLLSSCLSTAPSTYYVKPTPDTKCPGNPCFTLSEYAQNVSHYFTSSGTFDFLPGNHTLDRSIPIYKVSSVSFLGEQDNASQLLSWIICTKPAFFNLTQVQEIKIRALGFRFCGTGTSLLRAFYFYRVHQFAIEHSLFEGSSLLFSLSNGTLENVSFMNNTADQYGGAVLALNSSLVFLGITMFAGNKASLSGGAIYSEDSFIQFQDGARFENNMMSLNGTATGGAIGLEYTTLQFRGPTTFLNNSAFHGGAIFAFRTTYIYSNENISFARNSARAGGALFITQNSTIELIGNSNFTGNTGKLEGSVMVVLDSQVSLNGTNVFHDNHNKGLGGIFANNSNIHIEGYTVFTKNSVYIGAAMFIYSSNVTMSGTALFAGNTAELAGGALEIVFSSFHFIGQTQFERNSAQLQGGAINVGREGHLSFTGITVFTNNSCTGEGGGAVSTYAGHITFNGTTVFASNHAIAGGGGAIVAFFSTITIAGHSNFTANSAPNGGTIYSDRSNILFNGTGRFSDNTCSDTGGVMYIRSGSTISFNGFFHFHRNHASEGGAISTEEDSLLRFMSPVELVFIDNQAKYGGAIFVLNRLSLNYCTKQTMLPVDLCFFDVYGGYSFSVGWTINVHLTFIDNTAEVAGSVLYGGMLQRCTIVFANTPSFQQDNESAIAYFKNISNITSHDITPLISSDPVGICFCQNNTDDCEHNLPPFHRSPGQLFNVSVVAVDQSNTPVNASIRTTFSVESTAELGSGERTQTIGPFCSSLQYRVFSSNASENLTLAAQSQCNELGTALRSVSLMLLPCPNGFEPVESHCNCEGRLQQLATCDVETHSIKRVGSVNFWVNASYSRNGSYEGLIIHIHCPFDYCQANPVPFTLSDPNAQCAFNRFGFLCGGCDSGLSLTLGSLQCERCSNTYWTLLIAFAVLGFALVVVISLCRLTVGVGAINGLIFYANIVHGNRAIFFPAGDSNVLTVFIAWVNLDFGISTCFFNGLDSYTWTWLQFVFPFYIWLLVAVLILASKYSAWVTRLLGSNPTAVLATLFLLSYTKLLRTIITAFFITFLEYPDGTKEAVWLIDANIRYLHGQHIPLFVFALLVLFVLFLPYTVFLLLGQWLQAMSEFKVLSWMNNLSVKHFLDAYYGPYKPLHRYWTGFLLLVRCALFVVFAFNVLGDSSLNLLVIASSMLGVSTFLARLTKGIYKAWILDLLEASYFLNLGVLAAGTYHVDQAGGNQTDLAYVSVGIAFATFLAIAAVQSYKQFKGTSLGEKIPDFISLLPRRWQNIPVVEVNEREGQPVDAGDIPINAPTVSVVNVQLREPLLET